MQKVSFRSRNEMKLSFWSIFSGRPRLMPLFYCLRWLQSCKRSFFILVPTVLLSKEQIAFPVTHLSNPFLPKATPKIRFRICVVIFGHRWTDVKGRISSPDALIIAQEELFKFRYYLRIKLPSEKQMNRVSRIFSPKYLINLLTNCAHAGRMENYKERFYKSN